MNGKIAIYTVIFDKYDNLIAPKVIGEGDYICFTEEAFDAPHPWQIRIVEMPYPNPSLASRYYFDQSTVVCSDYEYTIMHSGNKALAIEPESLLEYLETTDIAAYRHPNRSTVYKELQMVIRTNKDTRDKALGQVVRYRKEGFSGEPLSACTLLIRRNTPAIQEFEELWWYEVSHGSHRDQLSFDYARWKLNIPITYIPGNVYRSKFLINSGKHLYVR